MPNITRPDCFPQKIFDLQKVIVKREADEAARKAEKDKELNIGGEIFKVDSDQKRKKSSADPPRAVTPPHGDGDQKSRGSSARSDGTLEKLTKKQILEQQKDLLAGGTSTNGKKTHKRSQVVPGGAASEPTTPTYGLSPSMTPPSSASTTATGAGGAGGAPKVLKLGTEAPPAELRMKVKISHNTGAQSDAATAAATSRPTTATKARQRSH